MTRFLPILLAALVAAPADAQLTIRLTSVPPGTPADARIHVAGSFNRWNPGDTAFVLRRQADGAHAITLPAGVRGPIEFKLTLGAWNRAELTAGGEETPNRAHVVPASGADTLDVAVARWGDGVTRARAASRSPNVSILSDSFPMPQLGRMRRVWLYLPPDYATSGARYPVIYVHDGQNAFDDATSYAGEWGIDETLDSLHALGVPAAIVVGVDNGQSHRMAEYNPWTHADTAIGGGEGKAYVEFLVRTLKPFIDRHYRTLSEPAATAIVGSSMGGLISLYAALEHPDVFGLAGVFSCACWVARPEVYDFAKSKTTPETLTRFYFVVGGLEGPNGQMVRDQDEMVAVLAAAGVPAGRLRALTADDGKHAEWFWRREFPAAYRWLFNR